MQHNGLYWHWAQRNLPPGCLWRLWRSSSTLTQPFSPDSNVFCWWTLFQAVRLLIPPQSDVSYLCPLGLSQYLNLQLAVVPQQFLNPHHAHSSSLSLRCLKHEFTMFPTLQASKLVFSCSIHLELRLFLPQWGVCHHLLKAVVVRIGLLNCYIWAPDVAKVSFLENWP